MKKYPQAFFFIFFIFFGDGAFASAIAIVQKSTVEINNGADSKEERAETLRNSSALIEAAKLGKVGNANIESLLYTRVFPLQGSLSCSASLVNIDDDPKNCHLITNFHCISPVKASGQDSLVKIFMAPAAERTVSILKKDPNYDLVELSLPKGFRENQCQSNFVNIADKLNVYVLAKLQQNVSVSNVGFPRGSPEVISTRGIPWRKGYGYTHIEEIPSNLKKVSQLIQVNHTPSYPGLSGGLTISNRWGILGIVKANIPHHDVTIVIPFHSVIDFINSPGANSPSNMVATDLTPRSQPLKSQSDHIPPDRSQPNLPLNVSPNNTIQNNGDNTHLDIGDNTHLDIGDASQANRRRVPLGNISIEDISDPLKAFREPPEGVLLSDGKILLGYDGFQIDGHDDLLQYATTKSGEPAPQLQKRVIQDQSGYPSLSERKDLLERLKGSYFMGTGSSMAGSLYVATVLHKEKENSSPLKSTPMWWSFLGQSNSFLQIFIEKDFWGNWSLELEKSSGSIYAKENLFFPVRQDAYVSLNFDVTFSNDAKLITLSTKDHKLTCDNKYFKKLICKSLEGAAMELSLSKPNDPEETLIYRWTYVFEQNQHIELMHYFGNAQMLKNL